MKYFDFLTGTTRGELDPKVVDTLLDQVDENEDGIIKYDEFSRVRPAQELPLETLFRAPRCTP